MSLKPPTIYLVEPIDHRHYKSKIVYSDNVKHARLAASTAHNLVKIISPLASASDMDMVYLDESLSICIEIEPTILEISEKMVKVNYHGKIYHLFKNEAENILEMIF